MSRTRHREKSTDSELPLHGEARRGRKRGAWPGTFSELAPVGWGASPTAIAAEAERSGVVPQPWPARRHEIPGPEDETMRIGDPDVSALANEYSGEEAPGSSTPTPDQNGVDDIGRAYGVEEEDASSTLRPSSEILDRRDRHRRS